MFQIGIFNHPVVEADILQQAAAAARTLDADAAVGALRHNVAGHHIANSPRCFRSDSSLTQLSKRIFSSRPPRPRVLLMRMPRSVPCATMLLATTLRIPPDVSLPSTTAPCPR